MALKDVSSVFLKWSIKKLIIISVMGFTLIQIIGTTVSLKNMNSVLNDSNSIKQETTSSHEKNISLGAQITTLEQRYLPLLQSSGLLLQASYEVNHEITRYVIQDSEDGQLLEAAHNRLKTAFEQVKSNWFKDIPRDSLDILQGNYNVISDIVLELLETTSPQMLEELDADARASAVETKQAADGLNKTLYASP